MTIRLLRLTNSDDFVAEVPEPQRAAAITERLLVAETGEQVETTTRNIWPAPALPGLVEGWMQRYEPDLVLIRVASYWFTYESVPLKLERTLGAWSRPLMQLGNRAAANRVIGHNRAFKLLQKAALNTIGGATLLTADETVELAETLLRRILTREGCGVVVRGPRTPFGGFRSQAALRKSEARRQYVNRRLAELCARYHVTSTNFEETEPVLDPAQRLGDGVHVNALGQRIVGELEGEALVREWRRVALRA